MTSILAVSAHPDDESLFAGGTLAMFAEQGANVYILETTRGEGGEVGEPPLTTPENLAPIENRRPAKQHVLFVLGISFFCPILIPLWKSMVPPVR